MNSIPQLMLLTDNFSTLGNLQEGERLSVRRDRIGKYAAPDRLLKHSTNFLAKVVNGLITFAIKIIQSLGRLFQGQNSKKDLITLQNLLDKSVKVLADLNTFNDPTDRDLYQKLKYLGYIHFNGTKALNNGLVNYRTTLLTGRADLIKSNPSVRKSQADSVMEVSRRINEELLPPFLAAIEEAENLVFEKDKERTQALLAQFLNPEAKEIDPGQKGDLSTKAVRAVIAELYGEAALDKALARYGLRGATVLSDDELHIIVTSIATNLTMEELKAVYANRANPIFHISEGIRAKTDEKLEDLPQSEILQLLTEVRNVGYQTINVDPKSPLAIQFNHDKNLLSCFAAIEVYRAKAEADSPVADIKKFSYSEYLAHEFIYYLFDDERAEFSEGILVPIYDRKDKPVLQEAHTLVSNKGLHGVCLHPALFSLSDEKVKIQVVFRGTYCKDSMKRDTSFSEKEFWYGFEGPGRVSFKKQEQAMLKKLQDQMMKFSSEKGEGPKLHFEFAGHSLGGCDAQRMCEYFTNHLARNKYPKIAGINLFAFNTPSLESDKVLRFSQNVGKMNIPFKLRYFDAHHDPVQEFGKMRLGYIKKGIKKPRNLFCSILKADRKVDEKVTMLSKGFLTRAAFRVKKAKEAHLSFIMRSRDPLALDRPNDGFIQDFFTDYARDSKIRYGKNREKKTRIYSFTEMNELLLTRVGRIAKSFKRVRAAVRRLPLEASFMLSPAYSCF